MTLLICRSIMGVCLGNVRSLRRVGFVVRLASQETRDGVVHPGNLGLRHLDVFIVELVSKEAEHVRQSLVGVTATQAAKAPVFLKIARIRVSNFSIIHLVIIITSTMFKVE